MELLIKDTVVCIYDKPPEPEAEALDKLKDFRTDYGLHRNLHLDVVVARYSITRSHIISPSQLIDLARKHGEWFTSPEDKQTYQVGVFIAERNISMVTYRVGESEKTDVFYIKINKEHIEFTPEGVDEIVYAALTAVQYRQKECLTPTDGIE